MKRRTLHVAGSFAQCALAVMAVTTAFVGVLVAAGCMVEAVTAAVDSERGD